MEDPVNSALSTRAGRKGCPRKLRVSSILAAAAFIATGEGAAPLGPRLFEEPAANVPVSRADHLSDTGTADTTGWPCDGGSPFRTNSIQYTGTPPAERSYGTAFHLGTAATSAIAAASHAAPVRIRAVQLPRCWNRLWPAAAPNARVAACLSLTYSCKIALTSYHPHDDGMQANMLILPPCR